jgi:hypothetical protein
VVRGISLDLSRRRSRVNDLKGIGYSGRDIIQLPSVPLVCQKFSPDAQ